MAIAVAMVIALPATAEVVKRSDGFTANCDNPTTREDGTLLPVSEIKQVQYFVDPVYGNVANPDLTVLMTGGCNPTFIDTKQLAVGTYYRYAITEDTSGLLSVVSVQSISDPLVLQNANPNAPGNVK